MVARLAIYQLGAVGSCRQLTREDLFRFLDIPVLIRRDQVGHSQDLGVVLVPDHQLYSLTSMPLTAWSLASRKDLYDSP